MKESLDREVFGKVERVSADFKRETSFVSDPSFEKIPKEILKIANEFKEEFTTRPFASTFDKNIIKLNEAWNRHAAKLIQNEKGKLLVDIQILKGMANQNKLPRSKKPKGTSTASRPKTSNSLF